MLKKLKISSCTKVIFSLIFLLMLFSTINFAFLTNKIYTFISTNTLNNQKAKFFITNILLEEALIILFGVLIIYFVKRIHKKALKQELEKAYVMMELNNANEILKKEKIILSQKEKIELQNKKIVQQKSLVDKLYKEALEHNKIKTEFFTNISHDLKTPVSVILSTIQLMKLEINKTYNFQENDSHKQIKYLNIISQNAYRIVRMINNLMQITKIESGFKELNLQNLDIIKLIRNICFSVSEYLNQKDIIFEFNTNIERKVIAVDLDKIEAIILNLLSNAAKFTKPGGKISVKVFEKNRELLICVKDTGPGIPKEKLNTIFDRFKQARTNQTMHYEGIGIGLSLVKLFVDLHDGRIEVQSQLGSGTEFFVYIPMTNIPENKIEDITSIINDNIKNAINIEFSEVYQLNQGLN